MLKLRMALAGLALAILFIIGVQNSDVVELQFLNFETSISLVALVFLTAAAGFVIGFVAGRLGRGKGSGS